MTTVWADIGDPDFPFAPIPGAFIEQGIGSRFGWTVVDNELYWHGQNEDGGRVAYRAQGYQPQRISTHAVEQAWAALSDDGRHDLLELSGARARFRRASTSPRRRRPGSMT